MKLILHIGTPKTGTTAIQRFLHRNEYLLEEMGVHYALPPHDLEHSNAIANALVTGDNRAVQTFLTRQVKEARRRGAETVLISSENFYARNVLVAMQRQQVLPNALERDRIFVETLRALLPDEVATWRIVCYFRRPDLFAESLYNQHIKRGIIDRPFDQFLSLIEPALFYARCMRSWADVFGQSNCVLRLYDMVRADVVSDFAAHVLGIRDFAKVSHIFNQANARISRDLLEFKRQRNTTASFGERDLESAIIRLVNEEMGGRGEPDSYQEFLSPDDRAELLRRLQPELNALEALYGVPAFPAFEPETAKLSWSPYPGLARKRRQEIELHYDRINGRVAFRLERMMIRSAGFLRRTVPGTGVVIDAVKRFGAKRALHRFAVGMQRGVG
jgi:hypothetical protein